MSTSACQLAPAPVVTSFNNSVQRKGCHASNFYDPLPVGHCLDGEKLTEKETRTNKMEESEKFHLFD